MAVNGTDLELTADDRAMIVRICSRFTRDTHAAEDLAQQVLLTAWRRQDTLRDPAARRSWLARIARTTCLMWARSHARANAQTVYLPDNLDTAICQDTPCHTDLALELERRELVELLDSALNLLPPETRDLLVRRYVHGLSQAQLAGALRISEGAVESRLQRGKAAARQVLRTDLSEAAVAHGIIDPSHQGWQDTRLWCPGCGARRMVGRLDPERGMLFLRCPGCPLTEQDYIHARMGCGLRDLKTFRPALSRVLESIHRMYRVELRNGVTRCWGCDAPLALRRTSQNLLMLACEACGFKDIET